MIEPVFVHLEIDDFQPFMLHPDEEGIYEAARAVPSGRKIRFFFTYRGYSQISNEYPIEHIPEPISKEFVLYDGTTKQVSAVVLNYTVIIGGNLTCKPRPTIEKYIAESYEPSVVETEWSIDRSIFSKFMTDNEVICI